MTKTDKEKILKEIIASRTNFRTNYDSQEDMDGDPFANGVLCAIEEFYNLIINFEETPETQKGNIIMITGHPECSICGKWLKGFPLYCPYCGSQLFTVIK